MPLGSFLLLYKFSDRLNTDKFRFRLGLLYSGYRPDRWWWEGVVAARKVAILSLASFGFNETIQVHIVLGLIILLLVAHYSFLPFDMTSREGRLLHGMERNSMLALICMLWAGVVFLMDSDQKCKTTLCINVHNALVLAVLFVNILLLSHGSYLFIYFFLKRNHVLKNLGIQRIFDRTKSSMGFFARTLSLSSASARSSVAAPTEEEKKVAIEMNELGLSGGKIEEVTNPAMHYQTRDEGVSSYSNPMKPTKATKTVATAALEKKHHARNGTKLPPGWKKHNDKEGRQYYSNNSTQESSWVAPAGSTGGSGTGSGTGLKN